jgi:signal transduction histidine kinase
MRRYTQKQKLLLSLANFFIFFLMVATVVTCVLVLFATGLQIPEGTLRNRATVTFAGVILLSLLFTFIDMYRRKFTVERPLRKILNARGQLTEGNFKHRITPVYFLGETNEFNVIIEELNALAAELAGIETLKTDFIANVSHELKTPLAVIQNYSTMLQSPDLTEEKRLEYAAVIANTTHKLSDLITNILKLNKLENQQIYPDKIRYDLSEQLRACLLSYEDLWEAKNLELETNISDDEMIDADPELMSLVWNNLISNAIKFSKLGGQITVNLRRDNGYVFVTVADNGCGISSETGPKIFDKFYQAATSHSAQGNGLGLALVKRVIDIVNGEISVRSKPGLGSSFTVRLPAGENKC